VGLKLEYPEGATPLSPEDLEGLVPSHITTRAQLNEWESVNVGKGEQWAFATRQKEILSIDFMWTLHKQMFGDTWQWAGKRRIRETIPGIAPEAIEGETKNLCENVKVQLKDKQWGIDEIAARFHHLLVAIHPFPNGNGRFARTMTDLVLVHSNAQAFTWGAGDLINNGEVRSRYIAALRRADAKDYGPLFNFVRSTS
jgi:Fic-DOC domain mobile mystery protein B